MNKALTYMSHARDILDAQLNSREVCEELASGFEMLINAFELTESPDKVIHVCPVCDSVYFEELPFGELKCLGCDEIIKKKCREEINHEQ